MRVHDPVGKEHYIDERVIKEIARERLYVFVGLSSVILGYLLQIAGVLV